MLPLVIGFEPNSLLLVLGENVKTFKIPRILRDQSSTLDDIPVLGEAIFFYKLVDIFHQSIIRDV